MRRLFVVSLLSLTLLAGCTDDEGVGFCAVALSDSPVRGPVDAWVTMVEFADFQCPYCARASTTVAALLEAYPDDLRLVFKHLPLSFHSRALPAALAAECAKAQGQFWPMHDLLFEQPQALGDSDLERDAMQLGLEMTAFDACRSSASPSNRVQQDVDLAGDVGVSGTPALFINGTPYVGARPYEELQAAMESARSAAQASGVERAAYYDSLASRACE